MRKSPDDDQNRISGIDKRPEISYSVSAGSSKELESDLVEARAKATFGKPGQMANHLGRHNEAAAEVLLRRRSA
jgi:hypothetical protein